MKKINILFFPNNKIKSNARNLVKIYPDESHPHLDYICYFTDE